ncbi:hypothetical protein ACLOJK_019992 [Asimina triloba]
MSTAFSDQFCRPISGVHAGIRRPTSPKLPEVSPSPLYSKHGIPTVNNGRSFKWALRQSLVDQSPPKTTTDAAQLVDFLYQDLPHLFDDQGIDRTMYDDRVKFRDPITKHDTIDGYLFNIKLLKGLFQPDFQLHHVKQTGPHELTTRWTMVMRFVLLPWKPELVFTGISIMGVNPQTQKFCSHVLRVYKTPDLETPKFQILKRTADYEVRKYAPFVVVETIGDKLSGSAGFNAVAGYIFGKNSSNEKIPMTTPVFTQAANPELAGISIQIVLPSDKEVDSLPDPSQDAVSLRKVDGGIAAVVKFSGKPTEDVVVKKEKALRSAVSRDGLKPQEGCLLARYNDPGRTWSFIMTILN